MFNVRVLCLFIISVLLLSGCGTTDSALKSQGASDSYVVGFHDGRHSGMQEVGNDWEHYIKDQQRFDSDAQYKAGWVAGEAEGKRLQAQAAAAGEAMGAGYTGYRVGEEASKAKPHPNKIAKDAMKGVDTSDINALEK